MTKQEIPFLECLPTSYITSQFRNMDENVICGGLYCNILLGKNELVILELYGYDEEEQVYIAGLMKDNISRLPKHY